MDPKSWKVFYLPKVELIIILCWHMVKGYQGLLFTLVSSYVEKLPQAYLLDVFPCFSLNNSFPMCIREGTITKSYQLIIFFLPWMGPLMLPTNFYLDNTVYYSWMGALGLPIQALLPTFFKSFKVLHSLKVVDSSRRGTMLRFNGYRHTIEYLI